MKMTEGMAHLQAVMTAIQKFRSIMAENGVDRCGNKWIDDGDYCLLLPLVKILDRETITPLEYYNLMFVVYRLAPEVLVASDYKFPDWPTLITEWDAEA